MMPYTYVSLVGFQVMAVINPLLAIFDQLKDKDININRVCLLATNQTVELAKKIKDWLFNRNNITVDIRTISNSLVKTDNQLLPYDAMISNLKEDEQIIFNLSGGMNFQISSMLIDMTKNFQKFYMSYSEDNLVHLWQIENYSITKDIKIKLPNALPIEELLFLQGLSNLRLEQPKSIPNNNMYYWAKLSELEKFQPITIDDITFDTVLNRHNKFFFIKYQNDNDIDVLRKLIRIAEFKNVLQQLYDKMIIILSNNKLVQEQLSTESQNKIKVFDWNNQKDIGELVKLCSPPRKTTLLNNNAQKSFTNLSQKQHKKTLYMVLGQDPTNILKTIISHQPCDVCIFYTAGNPHIDIAKQLFSDPQKMKTIFNHNIHVQYIPISITGAEILAITPTTQDGSFVNITPGTKAHTAFLSIWAEKYGLNIYSTDKTQIKCINRNADIIDTKEPSLASILLWHTGKIIKPFNPNNPNNPNNNETLYKDFLNKLRELQAQNGSIKEFSLQNKNISDRQFGTFWERFIAWRLIQCGAQEVYQGLKFMWSEETQLQLSQKIKGRHLHKTEIDVVARFPYGLFVISCKSGNLENNSNKKDAIEIEACAKKFGRFAIPLKIDLQYDNEPKLIENVYKFGWRTIIDDEIMKSMLLECYKSRKTTL